MGDLYPVLKSVAATLLMPFPVFLSLVVLGLGFFAFRRPVRGTMAVLAGCVLMVAASIYPVAESLIASLEDRYPPLADSDVPDVVGAIVVLGGDWRPDPDWPISAQLNAVSVVRLLEGVRLALARPEAVLIVSGGSGHELRLPVALGYARAAAQLGVATERIMVVDTPRDTAQEAMAVAERIDGDQAMLLVTSAWHMPRAMRHFQHVGLDPIPAPTQRQSHRSDGNGWSSWLPDSSHLANTEVAVREYLGLLVWRWEH